MMSRQFYVVVFLIIASQLMKISSLWFLNFGFVRKEYRSQTRNCGFCFWFLACIFGGVNERLVLIATTYVVPNSHMVVMWSFFV
jgi:hypothetical protein